MKLMEQVPETWNDKELNEWATANSFASLPIDPSNNRRWCDTVGAEKNGIRCIV